MQNVTCVAKAEIVKPLDGVEWGPVGRHMRDITRVWWRMLNTGITAAHLAHARGEPISTPIYDAVVEFLRADREWNRASLDSVKKRKALQPNQILARERRAEIALPSSIYGRAARRAEQAWNRYQSELRGAERAGCIPSFRDHISFAVRSDAWEIQKDGRGYILGVKLHGGNGDWTRFALGIEGGAAYDHFRRIAVLKKADKLAVVNKLTDAEKEERRTLSALKKKGVLTPEQAERLHLLRPKIEVPLGQGAIKQGDLQIRWEERRVKGSQEERQNGRKGMWMIYATYTREIEPKPTALDPDKVLAVHRGMHALLTYATLDGDAGILVPGDFILEKKRRFAARRDAFRRHRRSRGPGGIGHGHKRTYREYGALEDAEDRFIATQCQQWAARVVEIAKKFGCGTVLIEDYATIANDNPRFLPSWPWARLKNAVASASSSAGLALKETPSNYISQTCPLCLQVSAENRAWGGSASTAQARLRSKGMIATGRGDMFECVACRFRRHIDYVAVYNMLRSVPGFGPETLDKLERSIKKFVRRIEAEEKPPSPDDDAPGNGAKAGDKAAE